MTRSDHHVHSVTRCVYGTEGADIVWLCGHTPGRTRHGVEEVELPGLVTLMRNEVDLWKTQVGFLELEARYWKGMAHGLRCLLAEIESKVESAVFAGPSAESVPPEPPVGTRFTITDEKSRNQVQWERRDSGWYCPRVGCPNDPASWSDIYLNATQGVRVLPGERP